MPRYTITSQRQITWLRERFPRSPNRFSWAIGFSAECNYSVFDTLRQLAERQKLEKWWTVDPAPLP